MNENQIHDILSNHNWFNFSTKWYMWNKYINLDLFHAHVGGPNRDHLVVHFTKRTPPSEERIDMSPCVSIDTKEKLKDFLIKNNL